MAFWERWTKKIEESEGRPARRADLKVGVSVRTYGGHVDGYIGHVTRVPQYDPTGRHTVRVRFPAMGEWDVDPVHLLIVSSKEKTTTNAEAQRTVEWIKGHQRRGRVIAALERSDLAVLDAAIPGESEREVLVSFVAVAGATDADDDRR